MKIINEKNLVSRATLSKMAEKIFGDLVKAVVDVEQMIMVIDGELHSDEEAILIKKGSKQINLWGINIYPENKKGKWIEFDSMINLRPKQGNRSRGVDDPKIRKKIIQIVNKLVEK